MTFALNLISFTLTLIVLVGWAMDPFGSTPFWFFLAFVSLGLSVGVLVTTFTSK